MEADEKKCSQCAETVKAEAKLCRFCGHAFDGEPATVPGTPPPTSKGGQWGKGCLVVLAILIVLAIVGSLVSPGNQPTSTPPAVAPADQGATAEAPANAPSVGLVGPQVNAARSAQSYINMSGFSRRGLIEQLSSNAGDGYSVADATAAVDTLTVDWNEQAARSAKQYLEMTGFSCSGLIDQLSSDAGDKYTKTQARYGAEKAGAC